MKVATWLAGGVLGVVVALLASWGAAPPSLADEPRDAAPKIDAGRTQGGLQALYSFDEAQGPVVRDRAGVGEPVHLRIGDPKAVRRSAGSLQIRGKTVIRSERPAARISEAVRRTGEITLEAWIRPAKDSLSGPARIVTLSKSPNERNFTLGQDGNRFDVRLRTTATSTNGIPSLSSPTKSLATRLTHVVYTRNRAGRARIYVDGKPAAEKNVGGSTSNWDRGMRLALANELSGERPWQGTYFLVAIYNRDLLPHEVEQNFRAGPNAEGAGLLAERSAGRHFELRVAPLLARHCLECHDPATKAGELDLTRKASALAGGELGRDIVPGSPEKSRLWKLVEADEMPQDRPALSQRDKQILRKWIDEGATWTLAAIDPAVYVHEQTGATWLRRLTVPEYIETVKSTVGVDVSREAREILPPDLRADGFSNTAYNLTVDLGHVNAYSRLAEIIVDRMDVEAFAARFGKSKKLTDDNMRDLIAKMGKRLFRAPLAEHEVVTLRGISTTVASAGGDFEEAVTLVLEAMLQSPRFLYRVENQRGDGTAWPVGEYELASRMSYIIWGGPPDRELMRAAEEGELFDRGRVAAQVRRMLEDPRAIERALQFVDEWLNLGRLENLQPNREEFPEWDPRLAGDMRAETRAFFREVAWRQKRPLADLLNAQVTQVTPRLAAHYGLEPPNAADDDELSRYDLTDVPGRGGLLTQGSVLTVGGDEASMVARGLFVLHDLLRGVVQDPPPCVDTTPVPTKPGLTQRGIAEARIANVNCGGCHGKFEPLAFGLEKFDGLGKYHERDEHGNRLRDDGEILFPGTAEPVPYQSSAELMDLLAGSERVRQCLTWKVTQFALGRPLGAADVRTVNEIHQTAQQSGGDYPSLIEAIILSDLVQMTRTESDGAP